MKFYAKIRSERAEKGQGGNEYLDIDLYVGDAKDPQTLARFTVREGDNGHDEYVYGLYDENDECLRWIATDEAKGKRQKGERNHKCNYCNAITKTYLENWHCSNCSRDN